MTEKTFRIKPFDTGKSIRKASESNTGMQTYIIESDGNIYKWETIMERLEIIRKGLPYQSIDTISQKLNRPVKRILSILEMPQTTYNKKKKEHALLDSRDSELIVLIAELIEFGLEVFNHEEEKFQRWLKKPNISLGGNSPESLLDTFTGISEVRFCLNRIEYGTFA